MQTLHTYEAVADAIIESRKTNRTIADALDTAGLLLTPAVEKKIRLEMLNVFAACIESERGDSIIRWFYGESKSCTSTEMWAAVQAWLLDFVETQRGKLP